MVRLSKLSESSDLDIDEIYNASSPPSRRRGSTLPNKSLSPSPATSVSSDKENRSSHDPVDKGKGPMDPPEISSIGLRDRRKRPAELKANDRQTTRQRTVQRDEEILDYDFDPDQDLEERRKIRKGLRDLFSNLEENESEFLNPDSVGLEATIAKANRIAGQVKQTADATIDSAVLVKAAQQTYKRTVNIISGSTSQGIDLDELINKCKAFIRTGDGRTPSVTQSLHRDEEHDEDDDGDEVLNWEYLGRNSCINHIDRPPVLGFLLGPLSIEKRAKRVLNRRAALKVSSIQETRPEVLHKQDITQDENKNLSVLCQQITTRLNKCIIDATVAVDSQTRDDMTDEESCALLDKYGVSRNGGMALFKFVINPYSFGQTVENLFYVSFLIRDGKAGIAIDERGMPYLELIDEDETSSEPGAPGRHQAVLALDMGTWKELINLFDIKEPMILHRAEEEQINVGAKGWYA